MSRPSVITDQSLPEKLLPRALLSSTSVLDSHQPTSQSGATRFTQLNLQRKEGGEGVM